MHLPTSILCLPGSLALLSCKWSFPSEALEWETALREGARPHPRETHLCLVWATSPQFASNSRAQRSGRHRRRSQRSHQLPVSASLWPPLMLPDCPSSPSADVHRLPWNWPSSTWASSSLQQGLQMPEGRQKVIRWQYTVRRTEKSVCHLGIESDFPRALRP